jgi:hypothetical protein
VIDVNPRQLTAATFGDTDYYRKLAGSLALAGPVVLLGRERDG